MMGCQARMQMSIHDEKVVGLALARRGNVPIHMFSRAPPDSITFCNVAGTVDSRTGSGRRKQWLSKIV
jgi:hypothetical protein